MPWYIYIIIIGALLCVLIIHELSWKTKIKRRWIQITLSIVFAAVISPAVFHLIISLHDRQRGEAEQIFRDAVINGIYQQKVDYTQLEQLLNLKYKDIFKSSEEEAEKWAGEFLDSLSDLRNENTKIDKKSQELSEALKLKWGPTYKYILTSFDKRVEELSKKSKTKLEVYKDVSIVSADRVNQGQEILRKVVFPNGNHLIVELHTGVVDSGKITWFPNLIFRENISGTQTTVFVVSFRDNYCEMQIGHPRHEGVLNGVVAKDDPLKDEKFLRMFKKAINRAFESGFL